MAVQASLRVLSAPSNEPSSASATLRLVNKLIGAGELLKPGQPLDDFSRDLMIGLWAKTCSEVGETAFQAAWSRVLEKSTFRPDIAEIRRFLGLLTEPDAETEALDSLNFVVKSMRKHGQFLRVIEGAKREECIEHGDRVERREFFELGIPPPVLSDLTERAIVEMGTGDRVEGLTTIYEIHPALEERRRKGRMNYEWQKPEYRLKNQSDIERRWVRCYLKCRTR